MIIPPYSCYPKEYAPYRVYQQVLGFRNALESLLADFLQAKGQEADPARCRALAIAINGLLDGLWLEGCLAGELFEERELVSIALTSIEALIGLPIGAPATTQ